jgi:anaerobic selenocysteine-containing dehydrogenase
VGESKSDWEINLEMAKRLATTPIKYNTVRELIDDRLKDGNTNFEKLKAKGCWEFPPEGHNTRPYYRYEKGQLRGDGKPGFDTPTGKVELYSKRYEEWGLDPLPYYEEPKESPVSTPELAKEYPLILTTGRRSPVFFHSEHRMLPWLRETHPDPIVELHPDTAKKNGIKTGDWVYIETPRGKVKQKAQLTTGIDPRVVATEHGWWFPEEKTPDHGWDRSNINVVTDNDPAGYDKAMGATNLRVLMCKIYPAEASK